MPVSIYREYMVICDNCWDFVPYECTEDGDRAKDMYKKWRKRSWRKRNKKWLCPKCAILDLENKDE